jgi:hypothetical protein
LKKDHKVEKINYKLTQKKYAAKSSKKKKRSSQKAGLILKLFPLISIIYEQSTQKTLVIQPLHLVQN